MEEQSAGGAYFHSFKGNAPRTQLQTFAHQGQAPYGFGRDHETTMGIPNIDLPEGRQPVYHIKVTATPVKLTPGVDAPEYVVSADPMADVGGPNISSTRDGTVITHVTPDVVLGRQGVTIKPVQYDKYTAYAEDMEADQAMVHVYGGEGAAATRDLVAKTQYSREGSALDMRSPSGIQQLETGYARTLSKEAPSFKVEKEKIYNWIIPSDAGQQMATEQVEKTGFFRSLVSRFTKGKGEGPEEIPEEERWKMREAGDLFAAASMEMKQRALEGEEDDAEEEEDEDVQRSGKQFDLTTLLKPSVRYGGVEFAQPEFVGRRDAVNYKLHAVEVHQYIPLPTADEPWFSRNQMDPSTASIFGPMPLPFDPVHTGMVAPTFQQTMENHPAPVLSPEMARMFNHELPVATTQKS